MSAKALRRGSVIVATGLLALPTSLSAASRQTLLRFGNYSAATALYRSRARQFVLAEDTAAGVVLHLISAGGRNTKSVVVRAPGPRPARAPGDLIAYDARDDSYLVIWTSSSGAAAQALTGGGRYLSPATDVRGAGGGGSVPIALIYDQQRDRFMMLAATSRQQGDSEYCRLYTQRLKPNGRTMGGPTSILPTLPCPSVTFAQDSRSGRYLVALTRFDTGEVDVRPLTRDGRPAGPTHTLGSRNSFGWDMDTVAFDSTRAQFVGITERTTQSSDALILRLLNPDGQLKASRTLTRVSLFTADVDLTAASIIAAPGAKELLAVWSVSTNPDSAEGVHHQYVRVRRLDARTLEPFGAILRLARFGAFANPPLAVGASNLHKSLITWRAGTGITSGRFIYGTP